MQPKSPQRRKGTSRNRYSAGLKESADHNESEGNGCKMNWQKEAISELRNYEKRKSAIASMTERLRILDEKFKSIRCATTDNVPVMGGASRLEDSMLNNIAERQRLELNIDATVRLVDLTERGLSSLDDKQRTVLEKFYIRRPPRHVEWLMEYFCVEQSQVYRLKDDALYDFTIGMFGVIDY